MDNIDSWAKIGVPILLALGTFIGTYLNGLRLAQRQAVQQMGSTSAGAFWIGLFFVVANTLSPLFKGLRKYFTYQFFYATAGFTSIERDQLLFNN